VDEAVLSGAEGDGLFVEAHRVGIATLYASDLGADPRRDSRNSPGSAQPRFSKLLVVRAGASACCRRSPAAAESQDAAWTSAP